MSGRNSAKRKSLVWTKENEPTFCCPRQGRRHRLDLATPPPSRTERRDQEMIALLPRPDASTIQAYGAEFELTQEDVRLDLDNELTGDEVAALLQRDTQAMEFLKREWYYS